MKAMGYLAAILWLGVGYSIARRVTPKDPRPTRPRSAHIDTSAEEVQQDQSWSTGRVIGTPAAALCFVQAAAHTAGGLIVLHKS